MESSETRVPDTLYTPSCCSTYSLLTTSSDVMLRRPPLGRNRERYVERPSRPFQ